MLEKRAPLLCSCCQQWTATEHSDGWNAPVCFSCQSSLTRAWERAHKRRGLISFILITAIVYGLSSPTVQSDPLLLSSLVVVTLFVILWDGHSYKRIDQNHFIRRPQTL